MPLDPRLCQTLPRATRIYLRLEHLPRLPSRFIRHRVAQAVQRLARLRRDSPLRVQITLWSAPGTVRVAVRVLGNSSAGKLLASLVRGAPSSVRALYRPGRHGGTLRFTAERPRKA